MPDKRVPGGNTASRTPDAPSGRSAFAGRDEQCPPTSGAPERSPASSSAKPSAAAFSPERKTALAILEILYRPRPFGRSPALSAASALSSLSAQPPLPALLDEHCRQAGLSPRATALVTELVHGVLRLQRRLEALLRPFLRKPDSLPPWLRLLLYMAVLELFCLDRIPARATVHEAVSLARQRGGSRLAGLVNAVLRNLLRHFPEPCGLPPVAECTSGRSVRGTEGQTGSDGYVPTFSGAASAACRARHPHAAARQRNMMALVALEGSLPDWLAKMWVTQFGAEQAVNFARRAAEQPCPTWRLNRRRFPCCEEVGGEMAPSSAPSANAGEEDDLRAFLQACEEEAQRFGESGLALVGNESAPRTDPLCSPSPVRCFVDRCAKWEQRGLLTRQGAGALLAAEYVASYVRRTFSLANPETALEGATFSLWDACCGRGGKTCALLERGIPVTLASDPSPRRMADLRTALRRLGLPEPELQNATAEETACLLSQQTPPRRFTAILLDAPCSGTGTLGRTPELRLRLSPQRLAEAEKTQARLLRETWPVLAGGGLLFYVTCALNRRENEDQVAAFIEQTPCAELEEQQLLIPSLPGQDTLFVAVLRKSAG